MSDSLILELADFEHMVHTGIFSEETGKPQPLRFTVQVQLKSIPHYDADTSLDASKNYMDLKFACSEALGDTHFKLIEAVADHVCETLFLQDTRIEAVRRAARGDARCRGSVLRGVAAAGACGGARRRYGRRFSRRVLRPSRLAVGSGAGLGPRSRA